MLREEAAIVGKSPDYYLFHEHLEAENRPCYFREFIDRAHEQKLGYLGEASVADMAPQRFGEKVYGALQKLFGGNILATEQYMDFFRNRSFRQTLLVHGAAIQNIKRNISPEGLKSFLLSCALAPTRAVVPESGDEVEFRDPSGRSVKVVVPLLKAMLLSFFQAYPRCLSYDQLEAGIRRQLDGKIVLTDNDFLTLGDVLTRFMLDDVVRLHVGPVVAIDRENSNPLAFLPARHSAQKEAALVTNMRHENIGLTQVDARVLSLLDGTRPVDRLVAELFHF